MTEFKTQDLLVKVSCFNQNTGRHRILLLSCWYILLGRPQEASSETNVATPFGKNYGIQFIEARREFRVCRKINSTLKSDRGSWRRQFHEWNHSGLYFLLFSEWMHARRKGSTLSWDRMVCLCHDKFFVFVDEVWRRAVMIHNNATWNNDVVLAITLRMTSCFLYLDPSFGTEVNFFFVWAPTWQFLICNWK
jgi:hypothetical protein